MSVVVAVKQMDYGSRTMVVATRCGEREVDTFILKVDEYNLNMIFRAHPLSHPPPPPRATLQNRPYLCEMLTTETILPTFLSAYTYNVCNPVSPWKVPLVILVILLLPRSLWSMKKKTWPSLSDKRRGDPRSGRIHCVNSHKLFVN